MESWHTGTEWIDTGSLVEATSTPATGATSGSWCSAPRGALLAELRGESVTSTWATDYFQANPEEGSARRKANLEPEVRPRDEPEREKSANVEKLLWRPTAVKLDAQGRVYIVDRCRHRLQVYRKEP